MMKILITGAKGMLGRRLAEVFHEDDRLTSTDIEELDVTSWEQVKEAFGQIRPDWVIHAAAYTQVDRAESEEETAFRVNALGTRNIAVAASRYGTRVLYFSTDYIFDGQKGGPYDEWDPPLPLGVYGKSKLAGEWFVRSLNPDHLIVRTSWLFGPDGPNFVDRIATLARQSDRLRVVNDQFGSPSFTRDLAAYCSILVRADQRGTYHITNSGFCSWYDLASKVVNTLNLPVSVEPVSTAEYPTAARRPPFSVLRNRVLELENRQLMRSWQEAVEEHLRNSHD